jgi:DNA-binding beta-propeller fold protein YncE
LGIAFDGVNIWVANRNSNTVTELRASDGVVLGTFPVPANGPYGIAFDGTYIWVSGDSNMVILRASDGAQVASRKLSSVGVVFDGAYVWTAETNNNRLLKF